LKGKSFNPFPQAQAFFFHLPGQIFFPFDFRWKIFPLIKFRFFFSEDHKFPVPPLLLFGRRGNNGFLQVFGRFFDFFFPSDWETFF